MGIGTIRFILALIVLVAHTSPLFRPITYISADIAVQLFFILAGFYMFLILDKRYNTAMDFYKSRAFRIYPLYFVVAVLTLYVKGGIPHFFDAQWFVKAHILFSNITLFFQDTFLFLGYNRTTGTTYFTSNFWNEPLPAHWFIIVPSTWALGVELAFYLLAPILTKFKTPYLILIFLASSAARILFYRMGFLHDPWSYRFFFFEIALFILGGLMYRVYKKYKTTPLLHSSKISYIFYAAVLLEIVLFRLLPLDKWLLMGLFALSLPFIFKQSKGKIDSFLGDLSYPIYLSYWMFIKLGYTLIPFVPDPKYRTAIIIVETILFSIFITFIIQKPIDKYRKKYLSSQQEKISSLKK